MGRTGKAPEVTVLIIEPFVHPPRSDGQGRRNREREGGRVRKRERGGMVRGDRKSVV